MSRSLADIIPPSKRKIAEAPVESLPIPPKNKFPYKLVIVTLGVVLVVFVSLFFIRTAEVRIAPASINVPINTTLYASSEGNDLTFRAITVEKTIEKTVRAEGVREVNEPARGVITVFNEQETAQRLVRNTRFETREGLVFRASDSIVIPAGSAQNPGKVTVEVIASENGERFNIAPTSFTLPGLRGSALFEKVYARSEKAMTGGFSGARPVIDESQESEERSALQNELRGLLLEETKNTLKEGEVFFEPLTTLSYQSSFSNTELEGNVVMQEKGTMTALVFSNEGLGQAIMRNVDQSYMGEPLFLSRSETLTTALVEGEIRETSSTIGFSIEGEAGITWVIDSEKIAGTLAGRSRDAARTLLSEMPEVDDKFSIILRPFWEQSFPKESEDIKIIVKE